MTRKVTREVKGAIYEAARNETPEPDGSYIWRVTYSVHGAPVSNAPRGVIHEKDGRFYRDDDSFSTVEYALAAIAGA